MEARKPTKTFDELPDTITPYDYMEWRGVGEPTAREFFKREGFPRIQGTGANNLQIKEQFIYMN